MAAISALTAQNTHGVRAVHVPPAGFLTEQLRAIVRGHRHRRDQDRDAGQRRRSSTNWPAGSARHPRRGAPARASRPWCWTRSWWPPAGTGCWMPQADAALRRLFAHADVITPNIPELAVLARTPVATDWEQAVAQARMLAARIRRAGAGQGRAPGHGALPRCAHRRRPACCSRSTRPRHATANTHGTGCSLSAALATFYARSGNWGSALRNTKDWLADAIARADELRVGSGHGPVNHFAALWDGIRPAAGRRPDGAVVGADRTDPRAHRRAGLHPRAEGRVAGQRATSRTTWGRTPCTCAPTRGPCRGPRELAPTTERSASGRPAPAAASRRS